MTDSSMLFIYKWVVVGNDTHARCVRCSVDSAFNWPPANAIDGYVLPNGPVVRVSHSVSDEIPCQYPAGTESVYASEDFITSAPSWAQSVLTYMGNGTHIVICGYSPPAPGPFFVSSDSPTVPCVRKARVRLCIEGAADLPDAKLYLDRVEKHLQSERADKWDAMMFDPKKARQHIAIPVGAFLPATIEAAGREYQAVYQINEYLAPKNALVTIHLPDSAALVGPGAVLRRRRREPGFSMVSKDVAIIESVAT